MGVSNKITAVLNFVGLLCSVPIIGAGIWLASKQDNECVELARWPVIILGVLILLVSLAGFVGAYWNRQGLLAAYLFCMAVLIVLLLIFLVFAFVVTRPDGSYPIPGRAYSEYRLYGFSSWLRHYVTDSDRWDHIRSCLTASDVCQKLGRDQPYLTADQYFQTHLSPLQSGCCKPPTVCGYGYVNPTMWINPSNPMADADCSAWSNDQSQLCYGCTSCKAGLLGNLRQEWRKANIALIVAAVALIWVYIIGCSAYKNAQTEELFRRYKEGFV
ncbi:tetraspanin-2 [Phoenix dactylifera]|uniref:Tetraspanin-2 n=1 Tax=Phoenix dactylifera TaxID=42345 RepID=A0A8B7C7E3_PHODC|nr:tetraspanin-2 [Phoenix dactylifera]